MMAKHIPITAAWLVRLDRVLVAVDKILHRIGAWAAISLSTLAHSKFVIQSLDLKRRIEFALLDATLLTSFWIMLPKIDIACLQLFSFLMHSSAMA